MHVARSDCRSIPDRLSQWKFVESALPYFDMAIEALQNLDRGNRLVDRCVSYLSQLTIFPMNSCEPLNTLSSTIRSREANTNTSTE